MINSLDPKALFAAEVVARLPEIGLRIERDEDSLFLTALFVACSSLVGTLPTDMIEQQARFQNQGYRTAFPSASRWVIYRKEEPIGRIIIDWDIDGLSHCVDLALLPMAQGAGMGTHLLQAWIAVSDRLGLATCLQVISNHGARGAYGRLGFVAISNPDQPSITMGRPASG